MEVLLEVEGAGMVVLEGGPTEMVDEVENVSMEAEGPGVTLVPRDEEPFPPQEERKSKLPSAMTSLDLLTAFSLRMTRPL